MRFWFREFSGWLLIGLGLFVFYLCYLLLRNHDVVEAWPLTIIGVVLFRGGIHLLKVAVAARLSAQVQDGVQGVRSPSTAAAVRPVTTRR